MNVRAGNHLRKLLYGVILLFILNEALAAQISNPQENLQEIDPDLIWAQTLEGEHFNEFWTYQFYLDDGLTVYIRFSVVNFGGLKPPVTGVKLSVINFDDKIYQLTREYSLDKLVQNRKNFEFRPNPERELYFRGELPKDHMVRIRTSKNENFYDIEFHLENIAEGFQLGNGKYLVDGEEIGILTHIPYAEVSGYVAMNGVRKEVIGTAYMDHTFQNETTTRLMDSGYRFVSQEDAQNWDLLYFMLPDDAPHNQTIGYRVVNRDGVTESNSVKRIIQLVENETFGKKVGRIVAVDIGDDRSVRLLRTQDDEKFSIIDELGWVARQAARTFFGGEVIEFRGEAILMEPGYRPKEGFYNFFLVD